MSQTSETNNTDAFIDVPIWRVNELQGEKIDREGLPLPTNVLGETIAFRVSDSGDETTSLPVYIVGSEHGRSSEIGNPGRPLALWADQNGLRYSAISYKGANALDFKMIKSDTAPSGYIPYGLQEDDALLRALKASRILRANGVAAEWLIDVIEPQAFPIDGKLVGLSALKKHLMERSLKDADLANELPAVVKALEDMVFFITVRATDISERIWDFNASASDGDNLSVAKNIIAKAMTLTNLADKSDLSPDNPYDVSTYLERTLPEKIGNNYARLHSLGLVHRFPHFGNITMLGGIVDLDSIHGEPLELGDEEPSWDDILKDVRTIFSGFGSDYKNTLEALSLAGLCDRGTDVEAAEISFIVGYISSVSYKFNTIRILETIAASSSVRNLTLKARPEHLLAFFRKQGEAKFEKGLNLEKVTGAIRKTLTRYGELYSNNPTGIVSSKIDAAIDCLIDPEVDNLDEARSQIDALIAGIKPFIIEKQQDCAYSQTILSTGKELARLIARRGGKQDVEPNQRVVSLAQAITCAYVDMGHEYLTEAAYDNEHLASAISGYLNNFHNQPAWSEVTLEIVKNTELQGVHAGQAYRAAKLLPFSELESILKRSGSQITIHRVEKDDVPEEEWSWLSPLCYYFDSAAITLQPINITRERPVPRLLPEVADGATYAAMLTAKDENGMHHMLVREVT